MLNAKNIHFIGIGGIGCSSLAQILHHQKKKISGSDSTATTLTKSLKLSGIKISYEHKLSNISKKHQLIIYSPAIPADNPELIQARKLKIPCISYPKALGELTKEYYTIAIAGTHGKSTTTAMISLIAVKAGLDPTVVIGTKLREFKNRNYRVGNSNFLIIEACEYKESFLHFHPNLLIITNIEADHLDHYGTFAKYKKAFESLVKKVPKDGTVIINENDKSSREVVKGAKAHLTKWGISTKDGFKLTEGILTHSDGTCIKLQPGIPGQFNIENAAFAAISTLTLNTPVAIIEKSISAYKGSWRRLEYKRKKGYSCTFIDDYGHHPTEIRLTLATIREHNPKAKILCVFQPHQHSRTHFLLKEFGKSFGDVDEVIVPNIYKVRDSESDVKKVSTDDLVHEISKHHKHASNGEGFENTAAFIKKHHKKYDIIVTMGAGDIDGIYKML